MNKHYGQLTALAAIAGAIAAGDSSLANVVSNRSGRGSSLAKAAYRNWYSPWFYDIREKARGAK